MALGPEEMEKLKKLGELLSPSAGSPMSVQVDLKSMFVILATAAMCIGKDPNEIIPSQLTRTAFNLQNLLFKPDGELND